MDRIHKSRRWFAGIFLLGGVAVALPIVYLATLFSAPRLNVLLLTLDTTRADRIGAYGYASAQSPALDELASEGVLFEHAYSPAPLTLAVHASLFTGLYPPEHGLRTNGRGKLAADMTTLAETLTAAGYDTGAFVASFVVDHKFGLNQGFGIYDDDLSEGAVTQDSLHRFRDGRLVVDSALKWLTKSRSRPYFCWVHLYDPHAPYDAHAAEFGDTYAANPYDGEIAYVDRQVARLTEFLKGQPNTVVIVVGDHGEGLGEHLEMQHGYTLYNSTQHVPLLIRGAAGTVPGTRVPDCVSLMDLFPTVLELLQLPRPPQISGRSFVPALQGKPSTPRLCYGATDDPFLQNGWSPLRSLTTDRWKYIRTTIPELYDLQADPQELHNLAVTDPRQLAELEQQLAALEGAMQVGEASALQLTPAEQRAMESLGYVGGKQQPDVVEGTVLPDVKLMLPFVNATQTGVDLMEQGKLPAAETALREVVAAAPEYVSARMYLGAAYEQQGKLPEAEEAYETVLRQRPEHIDSAFHLAGLYADQGKFDAALAIYDRCLELEPDSALTHFNIGLAKARLGEPETAEGHFQEALHCDRDFPGVHAALGNVLARQGRDEEAIAEYQAELRHNPTSVEAHANVGVLLGRRQRTDEARQHLEEAVRLAPQNAEAQFNLGTCLVMLGEATEAEEHLREALRLRPELTGVRTTLGNLLLKQGHEAAAIAAYEAELQQTPTWLEAHVNLGALLGKQQRLAEARPHLEKAVRLAPRNADAQFNLGACYGMLGKLPEAVEHLEAALRLDPEHGRAGAELARIRKRMTER